MRTGITMGCKYLIVSSITYAIKAKEELVNYGINCRIEKIRNIQLLNGCGFGLKVSSENATLAARYVNLAGVKVIDIIDCEAISK